MVRTVKTKKELEEDLNTAIADARARYDSIVKPAQEKFKAVERQARITLEERTKPLWDTYPKEVQRIWTPSIGLTLYIKGVHLL
jgi:vacuolar-type H+-ATPase subunit H